MSGQVRERHFVVPALFAAAESPGGYILTVIGVLETEFQPATPSMILERHRAGRVALPGKLRDRPIPAS
jgi:hypothetical protein